MNKNTMIWLNCKSENVYGVFSGLIEKITSKIKTIYKRVP